MAVVQLPSGSRNRRGDYMAESEGAAARFPAYRGEGTSLARPGVVYYLRRVVPAPPGSVVPGSRRQRARRRAVQERMSRNPQEDDVRDGNAEATATGPEGTLDRVLAIVEFLRANCPWDRVQTAESLIPYLIEESREVVDAIRAEDARELEGELGDLLLNVVFQIVLAEEAGAFDRRSLVERLDEKMRRRHPHLFGGGERENWETLKAKELARDDSILSGLPSGLDPLLRAHRIQEKWSGVGFDWEDTEGAREKVAEELEEARAAIAGGDAEEVMEEAGDLLFAAVNLARLAGVHASNALARTNRKVEARFRRVEGLAREAGRRVADMSLEEMDVLWDAAKEEARRDGRPVSAPPEGTAAETE